MRWRFILNMVGVLTFFLGLTMILPILVGLYFSDSSVGPLFKSLVITVLAGAFMCVCSRNQKTEHISQREGMAIVAFGWMAVGLFSAFPFYFGGVFDTFTNSIFESVSGFTTTGASVLINIEAVPKGILFWRSLIQWL
ncbi:MAG: TrkH family potassium uptake protein, partial [Desulfobacterales bacterium]|nr:TrkH family potassium uptake protein [Desulfobacterales bacterium]